jgi:hypothetical protein
MCANAVNGAVTGGSIIAKANATREPEETGGGLGEASRFQSAEDPSCVFARVVNAKGCMISYGSEEGELRRILGHSSEPRPLCPGGARDCGDIAIFLEG